MLRNDIQYLRYSEHIYSNNNNIIINSSAIYIHLSFSFVFMIVWTISGRNIADFVDTVTVKMTKTIRCKENEIKEEMRKRQSLENFALLVFQKIISFFIVSCSFIDWIFFLILHIPYKYRILIGLECRTCRSKESDNNSRFR